ncbi:dipeptidyl peptidase IV [Sphingosinicella microcystinivorans]|uniref:Dipeptidyl peptidase IV n=1 Tax=Sphingosinicella microcystinivorans TaxID=335406 RepID=A0AAD1G1T0_SPHMI|nr:prolyl oligopeptidase family serine peptidase [Sphingosinicella microcystinivorans]BBE35024.1 dipeptidyl peptidase IV [Sphingosinicella microcystinivorans]
MIVESATGRRTPAFDTARLRTAAERSASGVTLPAVLPATALTVSSVTLTLANRAFECALPAYACSPASLPAAMPDTGWAPEGRHGLFVRNHDLYLRARDGNETVRLTSDGAEHFAYGALSGMSLMAVPLMRSQSPRPPFGITWSPDGGQFMSTRFDERKVESFPFVEAVPQDGSWRPKLWQPRIALVGDAERGDVEAAIFDVAKRSKTVIALKDGWRLYGQVFHWSADGRSAYGLVTMAALKAIGLAEIDLATGAVRIVVQEATPKWGRFNAFIYSQPNVRILEASREVLWFSERDGWGQVYFYDLGTGKLKRKLTAGQRTVRDIIGVDEKRRHLFFTAGGTDADPDPYFIRLYSTSLDGGAARLLSPETGVHLASRVPIGNAAPGSATTAALSPDGNWIVESHSALDRPPVAVLRSARDGRVVAVLETADVSRVAASGWRAPTRVKVLSADGKTPLWGTVYFPPNMRQGQKYPVIDAVYGGPQVTNAPADYREAVVTMNPRSRASLAELGFIVVMIDGRGTPGRSKAFNNESYEVFAELELADHVAGIRQLAERFGSFDLDRVGVYGHSFGGYTSARAILAYPDFYKLAVSSAGPHNFQGFYPVEGLFPAADYGDGKNIRPNPAAVPPNYARLDLMPLAPRLKGKLILVYGEMDENALPSVTLQMADALIKANKSFDLMYLPNQTHDFFRTSAYYTQRMWDYFIEHLMREEPPADFWLEIAAPSQTTGY